MNDGTKGYSWLEANKHTKTVKMAPKRNKLKLVSLSAVRALSRLLAKAEPGTATVEKVLMLVEAVSSTSEVQKEICEDATCFTVVLRKVLKV
ncbi:hypothetical protein VIGAN_11167800 [Vigna angularis var. angularis]|uniref:U-box domain-containing protein n=1 Tax=Vigna angularis var. angularis TaxID=157739 RepID=A0A0S3TAU7_PHAAN|nr:hypothetical protein VIGAN_11167800 [Vigna angularis var. angularis]